jgi:hypothetical protein
MVEGRGKYRINQAIQRVDDQLLGFALTDLIPFIVGLFAGAFSTGIFRSFIPLIVCLVLGGLLSVYIRDSRKKQNRGHIIHTIYRWTSMGAVKGEIPPGDKICDIYFE